MLQTHEPVIFSIIVFILMRFDRCFDRPHHYFKYVRFDLLSKAFSNYLFAPNSVKIKFKLESVRSETTPALMHFR